MSKEDTKTKNEILRKINYQKMKKAKLPNFTRIEREKILAQRDIEQRQLLMNQSQTSLDSAKQETAATVQGSASPLKRKTTIKAKILDSAKPPSTGVRDDTSMDLGSPRNLVLNTTTPKDKTFENNLDQMSFSQAATGQAPGEPPMTKQSNNHTAHLGTDQTSAGATVAMIRLREEMEARDAKRNKRDFIGYCTEVLTQSKNKDKGDSLPSDKQKHKVLQQVIEDPQ